ncbi:MULTISPECIES: glycosyltransferase [unclassified Pseudomonas]|uniref:glycosyltransferase family 8 protein n=1 Tax=unclassified Pseudomonas TaxID=196821 RepID=UPI001F579D83
MKLIYHPLFEIAPEYVDLLVDLVFGLMERGETDCPRSLIKYLVAVCPFNLKLKALEVRLALEVESEEAVEELFSQLTLQDFMMEPSLASVRIDFLCEKNRLDCAGELIAFYTGYCFLPCCLLSSIIYYYIEVGDLVTGRKLLRYLIRSEFCYHRQMQAVLRMIDSERSAQEVVEYIEDVEGWYRLPDLMACRAAVSSLYHKGDDVRGLSPVSCIDLSGVDLSSKIPVAKNVILLCVDKSYRIPALVAIFDVVREMNQCSVKPVFALFLPESEISFWEMISGKVSQFAGLPEFLLIHENMPEISKCRERYGYHTVRTLSSMAYGRLFAIKMLCGMGFGKLIYLDADIVVVNDLMPMFAVDQMGFPVSGVVDRKIDKVVRAMKLHGISNQKYLNSGVMLFDLKHPATEVILQKAIGYVLDPEVELIYHDQCAINKALKGHFHPLSAKYNSFLFPGDINYLERDSVVWHFLDSPKPWQISHRGGSGPNLWHKHFLLAQADLRKLGIHDLEALRDGVELV